MDIIKRRPRYTDVLLEWKFGLCVEQAKAWTERQIARAAFRALLLRRSDRIIAALV